MLNNKIYTKMKAITLNEENLVLALSKSEIDTICTGLATLQHEWLIKGEYDLFNKTMDLYMQITNIKNASNR